MYIFCRLCLSATVGAQRSTFNPKENSSCDKRYINYVTYLEFPHIVRHIQWFRFPCTYWDADDDLEDIQRYITGGFHPIRLGDVLKSSVSSLAQARTRCLLRRDSPRTIVSLIRHSSTILHYYFYFYRQHYVALKISVAKTRAGDLQPALIYASSATKCTTASGPLFIAGTEWRTYRSRAERPREPAERV